MVAGARHGPNVCPSDSNGWPPESQALSIGNLTAEAFITRFLVPESKRTPSNCPKSKSRK
jgi:hypothetical protein